MASDAGVDGVLLTRWQRRASNHQPGHHVQLIYGSQLDDPPSLVRAHSPAQVRALTCDQVKQDDWPCRAKPGPTR